MAYTMWGQRKALGRRYSWDPALQMEQERLEREYNLIPGREARGMQAYQFGETLGMQKEANKQAAVSGMVGTGGNLAMSGIMLNAYRGKPLLGDWGAKTTPGVVPTTQTTAGGGMATENQAAMATFRRDYPSAGLYETAPAGGIGATSTAVPTVAGEGITAGGGTTTPVAGGMGVMGYVAPAAAGYVAAKEGPDWGSEEVGKVMATGVGLRGNKKVGEVGAASIRGAGAGAVTGTMIAPGVGTIVGTIVGAIAGGLTELFGW